MTAPAPAPAPRSAPTDGALRPFAVVLGVVAAMWVVELIDLLPRTDLDRWGIRPRQLEGLVGVVTSPFLHAGFGHLISNTIPFLVLGGLIAASGSSGSCRSP